MQKKEGWHQWCAGGKPEGPESPEEVERQLERLRESHPDVADETEDEEGGKDHKPEE